MQEVGCFEKTSIHVGITQATYNWESFRLRGIKTGDRYVGSENMDFPLKTTWSTADINLICASVSSSSLT